MPTANQLIKAQGKDPLQAEIEEEKAACKRGDHTWDYLSATDLHIVCVYCQTPHPEHTPNA